MNPQEIAQLLASGDPKKVKEAQVALQALGYPVKPDGKLGDATSKAVADYRTDAANTANTARDTKVAEAEGKKAENDPINRLTKLGTEVLPYGVGVGIGTGVGHVFGKEFKKLDEKSGRQVSNLAQASDIDPVVKEKQMNRLMGGRTARNTAQFAAPALLAGAGYATREFIAPQFSDPGARDIVNSVGTGENAAAATLGVHQTVSSLLRGSPYDQTDVARIRSDALPDEQRRVSPPRSRPLQTIDIPAEPPRAQLPAPAAQAAPEPPQQHSQRLRQAATAAGAKPGRTKEANYKAFAKSMTPENMPEVAKALNLPADVDRRTILQRAREMTKSGGKASWLLPLAAGGLAYSAAQDGAEAAGGSPGSQAGAATAAATAAGTAYGANKLLQAVPRVAPVLNVAGAGLAAYDNASEAQAYQQKMPEDVRDTTSGRMLSHAMPLAMRGATDIASIAAAPGQIRDAMSGHHEQGGSTMAGFEPPAAAHEADFDTQLAELQSLLAEIQPAQAAPQSFRAAQEMPQTPSYSMPTNRLLAGR
jgi:hypothetical protein